MKKTLIIYLFCSLLIAYSIGVTYAWLEITRTQNGTVIIVGDLNVSGELYYLSSDVDRLGEYGEDNIWSKITKDNGINIGFLIPGETLIFKLIVQNNSPIKAALQIKMINILSIPQPLNEEASGLDYFTLRWGTKNEGIIEYNENRFMRELIELNSEDDIHTGNITLFSFNHDVSLSDIIINENDVFTLYIKIKYDGSGLKLESQFMISTIQIFARQI